MRDDEDMAVDALLQLVLHHSLDRRIALHLGKPRLRLVDADKVGARIFRDQVEAAIGAVGLGVDGEELGLPANDVDQAAQSIMPWPKSLTITAS